MSEKVAETLSHAFHAAEHTEAGKRAIHSVGTTVVAGLATIAPFAPAVVVAFGPAILVGAAVWGLCKLFK